MNCWKCNQEITSEICSNCGANNGSNMDLEILSAKNYNLGLKMANKNHISTAINYLEKSIEINSNNIDALNLLGLCYSQIGIVSKASKYWILSCMINNKDNIALRYLNNVEKNLTKREQLNDSIKKYNQSLSYFRQGNFDISTIQLKKVIETNPNFLEAKNLLALVYIKDKKISQAQNLLGQVLEIDSSNEKALRYLSSISINSSLPKQKAVKTKPEKNINYSMARPTNDSGTIKPLVTALSFLAGALLMFLLMFLLIIPAMNKENENKVTEIESQLETLKQDSQNEINTLTEEKSTLQSEKDELTTNYNNLLFEYSVIKTSENLTLAEEYFNSRNYIECISLLENKDKINDYYLKDEDKSKYDELVSKVYPLASQTYYNNGKNQYNNKEYAEAIELFNKSIEYGNNDVSTYDDVYYYRGRSYEELGENQKAISDFNYVLENFPSSSYASYSKSKISKLSN